MDTKVLSRLQALCVRREYCSKDIFDKALKALEGDAEGAAQMLSSLKEDGFVDDGRYAAAFARDKSSLGGWGPVKIRGALRAKGVSEEIIASALGSVDATRSSERMTAVLRSRYRALEGDPQAKLKLLRYALARGYTYDQVRDEVDAIVRGD